MYPLKSIKTDLSARIHVVQSLFACYRIPIGDTLFGLLQLLGWEIGEHGGDVLHEGPLLLLPPTFDPVHLQSLFMHLRPGLKERSINDAV
jgi:hypothetical protein